MVLDISQKREETSQAYQKVQDASWIAVCFRVIQYRHHRFQLENYLDRYLTLSASLEMINHLQHESEGSPDS
jgi:hypothetical protein